MTNMLNIITSTTNKFKNVWGWLELKRGISGKHALEIVKCRLFVDKTSHASRGYNSVNHLFPGNKEQKKLRCKTSGKK